MKLAILGTRGVPASHGGFETFAEHLGLYLAARGWEVTIYCQVDDSNEIRIDSWEGVRRVLIPVRRSGAIGTIEFDFLSIRHLVRDYRGLVLTLGYNTAIFCSMLRVKGIVNLINMDGLEWKREKWSFLERTWLWINERAGCLIANHLIADHPEIASHLNTRVRDTKITMIPYGADVPVMASNSDISRFGISPRKYALVIARPEPENSILEIVKAFSRKSRGHALVVLGNYRSDNPYHMAVKNSASDEVHFLGAIYDSNLVGALRVNASLYVHGHKVGGTNPSLVEAMAAGSPILAQDNKFNRWVAGSGACFFGNTQECERAFDELLSNKIKLSAMSKESTARYEKFFTWDRVLSEYENLLLEYSTENEINIPVDDK